MQVTTRWCEKYGLDLVQDEKDTDTKTEEEGEREENTERSSE